MLWCDYRCVDDGSELVASPRRDLVLFLERVAAHGGGALRREITVDGRPGAGTDADVVLTPFTQVCLRSTNRS